MKGVDQEKRQGKRGKKGWERKWANNHRLRWKHEPGNNRYYMPAHLQWNCICFPVKGSETKHVRAAINGHSWQTPSFGCLAAHQITWQAPKCIMALNGLAMTQGILTISWHSAFQCVFYGSSLWTLRVMMTIRHKCVCVRGDSWSGEKHSSHQMMGWHEKVKEKRSGITWHRIWTFLRCSRRTFCVLLFSRVATLYK